MSEGVAKPSASQLSDRRRQWTAVLLVVAGLFVLRVITGWPFSGPWYEPDESSYALRAYHVACGDGLSWRHPTRPAGSPGAPILMAVPWLLAGDNTDAFVQLTYAMNSLLLCGIVVVGYAAFRRWFGHWASLLGAVAMALYGPIFIYGFSFLNEPLFFFLFVLTVWIAQRIADSGRWYWWLALGLAAGASQVARITGFAFVAAAVVVAAIHLIQQRDRAALGHLACVLVGLVAILWPIGVLDRPKVEAPAKVGTEVSSAGQQADSSPAAEAKPATTAAKAKTAAERRKYFYSYTNSKQENINLIRRLLTDVEAMKAFGTVILWALNYVILASLALPLVLAVRFALLRWRRPPPNGGGRRLLDPGIAYMVLACVFTLGGIILRLGMSQMATLESMYGRYLEVVVMLCIGVGAAYMFDGLVAAEHLFSLDRQQSARTIRRAEKRGLPQVPPGATGAYIMLFVVSLIVLVAAAVTLPNIKIIFSGNLGVNYAAQIGGRLAGWYGYTPKMGGSQFIAVVLAPLLAGVCYLGYKRPRAGAIALVLLIVVSSAISYQQSLVFMEKNRAQAFHDFAREATDVLNKHFKANPKLARAVVVAGPDWSKVPRDQVDVVRKDLLNSVWSLEFYNRDVQFLHLGKTATLYARTPIYSMWPRRLDPLLERGNLRIYNGWRPAPKPPEASGGTGGGKPGTGSGGGRMGG